MDHASIRNERLARLDISSRELMVGPLAGFSDACAKQELETLAGLADSIVRSLRSWRERFRQLEVAARGPFSVPAAARLVAEAVFDDLLEPEASRVLSAAMDAAL